MKPGPGEKPLTLDHPKPDLPRTGASRLPVRSARARAATGSQPGFTLIEVMVAALIVVSACSRSLHRR